MKIWRVQTNTALAQYDEKGFHLIHAPSAIKAIEKALREAKKDGCYKRYDATSVELVGDSV